MGRRAHLTTSTRVPDGLPTSTARIGRSCQERPSSTVRADADATTDRKRSSERRGRASTLSLSRAHVLAPTARADFVDVQGDSLLALGEVLRLAGRTDEAADATRQALAI